MPTFPEPYTPQQFSLLPPTAAAFAFDEGDPGDGQTRFGNWSELMTAIGQLPAGAAPVVVFLRNATIPPGRWDMRQGFWEALTYATGSQLVTLPDDCTIANLRGIRSGLAVQCDNNTTDSLAFDTAAPGGGLAIFLVGFAAVLFVTGTHALYTSPGGGNTIVFASEFASFGAGIPPLVAPFVSLTAGDTAIGAEQAMQAGVPQFPDGWVTGPVGTNLAYQLGAGATVPPTPGFLGTRQPDLQMVLAPASLAYAPAAPADWAGPPPALVGDAIDRLAAAVAGLLGGPIP